MTYSIQALSQLAGVSPRTLRYYDRLAIASPTQSHERVPRILRDRRGPATSDSLFPNLWLSAHRDPRLIGSA